MQKRLAVIVGFPYHAQYLADLMNERSSGWTFHYPGESYMARITTLIALRKADLLICFGGPAPDAALAEAARRFNVPVVVIWAGTDVITSASDPGHLEILKQEGFTNIATSPWLVDELRELGIDAKYVPVASIEPPSEPAPLPSDCRVLTYLPEPRRKFYGEKAVYAIARACPNVIFDVVGRGHRNQAAPANVRFLGHVGNVTPLIDRSTLLLRLPEHDGTSMMVVESLARGRHVVWVYDFPSVHQVNNLSEAVAAVTQLVELHREGALEVNRAGFDFARSTFTRERIAQNFEAFLNSTVEAGVPQVPAERTVAISGFALFAAQVARAAKWATPDWEARVLRGRLRLERLIAGWQLLRSDVWYSIGAPIPDRFLHIIGSLARKPRVIHWVGSDVESLKTNPEIARLSRSPRVRHLAEVSWMIEELASYGVHASLAPLPPQVNVPERIAALPDRFTVLLYVPRSRGDFYGRREYERLFRHFAGRPIRFIVVGGGEIFVPPGADVEVAGWKTDLSEIYERSSALLRFTRHDGLSLMALEMLCYGRHLMWSQDFPFATQVRTYAECEAAVEALLKRHERGELLAQHEASRYIRETYDTGRCVRRIAEFWGTPPRQAVRPLSPLEAKQ